MGLDEATRTYEQSQYIGGTFQREKGFEIFCPQYFPTRSQKNGSQDCFTELCHQTSQENFFKCLIIFWSEDFTGTCVCVCVQGRVTLATCYFVTKDFPLLYLYPFLAFWSAMFLSLRKIQQHLYCCVFMAEGNVHAQVAWGASISSCQAWHSILQVLVGMFFKCQRSNAIHIHHIWAAVKSILPVVFVVAAIFEWSWFGWLSASLLRYSKMGPPAHLMVS